MRPFPVCPLTHNCPKFSPTSCSAGRGEHSRRGWSLTVWTTSSCTSGWATCAPSCFYLAASLKPISGQKCPAKRPPLARKARPFDVVLSRFHWVPTRRDHWDEPQVLRCCRCRCEWRRFHSIVAEEPVGINVVKLHQRVIALVRIGQTGCSPACAAFEAGRGSIRRRLTCRRCP